MELNEQQGTLSWREREVLQNCHVSSNYHKLLASGDTARAKCYLGYQVNHMRIHETNLMLPKREPSVERIPVEPGGTQLDVLDETDFNEPETSSDDQLLPKELHKSQCGLDSVDDQSCGCEGSCGLKLKCCKSLKNVNCVLKLMHTKRCVLFFIFNILLPALDVLSDILTAYEHFSTSQHYWGYLTTVPIFAPLIVRLCISIFGLLKGIYYKNRAIFEVQCFGLVANFWNIPGIQLIKSTRIFFALCLMDTSLANNSTLMFKLNDESLEDGILEAFLESAPQFVLQIYIILITSNINTIQPISIPFSFLSLALSSTKLFYSQRLGRFTDVDAAITHWITLLPIVCFQILGPLFSLVLMAVYLEWYIFICIGGIVLTNFLVLVAFQFKCGCPPDKDLEDLHKRSKSERITNVRKADFQKKSRRLFMIAVITSWVSTTTVWTNNFLKRSKFLLISGITSSLSHMICLAAVYLRLFLGPALVIDNAPITHCFIEEDYLESSFNFTSSGFVLINNSATIRPCESHEAPTDLFACYLGPAAFTLLALNIALTFLLQNLGHYLNLYSCTKIMCCSCCLIIHPSLIHDYLRNPEKIKENEKVKMKEVLKYVMENDSELLNKKDPLFGWTSVHFAIENDNFEALNEMLKVETDFAIKNNWGKTALTVLSEKSGSVPDSSPVKEKLDSLKEEIKEKIKVKEQKVTSLVWAVPPMHRAITEKNPTWLCFLYLLGGHWGSQNSKGNNVQLHLLQAIENGDLTLDQCNWFVKYMLSNNKDHYGRSILPYAAAKGMIKSLKVLIESKARVNVRKDEKGKTALHSAAKYLHVEAIECLIAGGANINSKCFDKKTALHVAIERDSHFKKKRSNIPDDDDASNANESTKAGDGLKAFNVLLDNNADVNAKSANGGTPLHLAALLGKTDFVLALIEKKSDINAQNNLGNTPIMAILTSQTNKSLDSSLKPTDHDRKESLSLLIQRGANLQIQNKEGKCAKDFTEVQDLIASLNLRTM